MAARNPSSTAVAHVDTGERLLLIAAFAGLAVMLFAAAMTGGIDYDEEQYVAGAYFAQDLALYRDFISFQPPPYTWLVARVFEASGGWYLQTARLVTWLFGFASCLLLYSLLRSVSCGRIVALFLVGAFTSSPFLEGPLVETRNDIQPLFLVLAGLRLFVGRNGVIAKNKYRLGASGLLFSLAAATKYSYVFAAPIAAVTLVYDVYREREGAWLTDPRIRWFVVGACAGVLPLAYALYAHRGRFLFMTLQFHAGSTLDWYQSNGRGEMLTLSYKLAQLPRLLVRQGNASLAILVGASLVALALRKPRASWLNMASEPTNVALAGLFIGALVIAILVGPHAMYYAPVAALLALIAGRLLALAEPGMARRVFAVLMIVSVVPALPAVERYGRAVKRSTDVEQWTGVQVHRSANRISRLLAERGIAGDVATLFPTVVIDGNPVRREFATGPFFFRSAGLYSADEVARLHGAGAATLDSLFAGAPPAAIVGGFGPFELFSGMDAALVAYAQRADYTLAIEELNVGGYWKGKVWIRPAAP